MGKDGKGWKSKGKPPLRSEGERQHARAVNAARAAEGLPNKSTGSVSRSKARALAHREKSQAVPADSIGEPAVLPPAPPKAPPRERIVLTAAQKGEVLPKPPETDRSRSPAAASLGGTGSPQVQPEQPKEGQPKGEVLPADQEELQPDSSTESTGAPLPASSSGMTPWQRRVRLRAANRPAEDEPFPLRLSISPEGVAELHGITTARGVPKDVLAAIPNRLAYEWSNEGVPHLAGTQMVFVKRGSDKAAFEAEGLILKLSLQSQTPELRFSGWMPHVIARTFWQERVLLRLHSPMDGVVLHTHELFLTCQEKTLLATELFSQRGEHWTFKFLAYVGCLLTYVASMGIVAKDTGATNLGVKLGTASAANPQALFFDTMSWTRVKPPAKPSCKWSGWFECAKSWCPFQARWLRDAASTASSNPSGTFRRLFSECQSYEEVLVAQGIMAEGEMVLASLPRT